MITIGEADAYFATRLDCEAWTSADSATKTKALAMATRAINRLSFIGLKSDVDQADEWPRDGETTPDDIKIALCEESLSLLNGNKPEAEVDSLNISSFKISSAQTTYERQNTPDHIRHLITSPVAWAHLKPYISSELCLTRA